MSKITEADSNISMETHQQNISTKTPMFNEHSVSERLLQKLENSTKTFNSIDSQNAKLRLTINSLGKERTLYDNVFKELELQMGEEEKKISP